jgi:hypothetical protein
MLDIESLYLNLQMTGIISTKSTHGEEDGEDPELDELFENPEAEENKTNRNRHQYETVINIGTHNRKYNLLLLVEQKILEKFSRHL